MNLAATRGGKATPSPPEIESAVELLGDERIREPVQLVAGLMHLGDRLVVGGSSKTYKSWLLLKLGLSVSTGRPLLKWGTVRGRVLYINLELPRWSVKKRLHWLAEASSLADEKLCRLDTLNLRGWRSDDILDALPGVLRRARDASGMRYALLIIDPVYRLLGARDENKATDVADLLGELGQIAHDAGSALAYAAHYSKGNKATVEPIDRISGSGVWLRDADAALLLTRHEAEPRKAYTVDVIVRDLPEQPSFVVEWKCPCFAVAGDLDPLRLKKAGGHPLWHKAEDILRLLPDKGLTVVAWQGLAEEEGICRSTFYQLKRLAVDTEKACKQEDGKWHPIPQPSPASPASP